MALLSSRLSRRNHSTRAFSLTEMAVVLGIVGLVLGGIWTAANMVHLNNQTQLANTQTAFIVQGYRSLYSARGVDTPVPPLLTDVTCTGVTNGYFPPDMIIGGCLTGATATYPVNPWNGYAQVFADPGNQGIQVGYYNISQEGCNRYADAFDNNPDVLIESISGTAVTLPATPATAAADCVAGAANSVLITFRAR